MNIFQICEYNDGRFNACGKAPVDVQQIVARMGAEKIQFRNLVAGGNIFKRAVTRIYRPLLCVAQWLLVFVRIRRGSVLVIQYPNKICKNISIFFVKALKRLKGVKPVLIIHDIPNHEDMRNVQDIVAPIEFLDEVSSYDTIIVHNATMLGWFISQGIEEGRLVNLEIFDYLIDGRLDQATPRLCKKVVIAGNLDLNKAGYLESLKGITDVEWHLFGGSYNTDRCNGGTIRYCGSKRPEDLPRFLKEGFGLVWDGPSADTCEGGWGAYLKINNPHKMSLYLASGLPVIIWAQAAQAEFVKKYGVGIVIERLADIGSAIDKMSEEEYIIMRKNVEFVGASMRSGAFLMKALTAAM